MMPPIARTRSPVGSASRRVVIGLLAATVALAGTLPAAPRAAAGACPDYASPVEAGRITDQRINEVSGLVRARFPGVLWFHEDSGNGPWLYATSPSGDLRASIEVLDATNRDWEDMARAMGRVWIGDIGDNAQVRTEIQVYWFPEPSSLETTTVSARLLTLRYPDDAMVVDGRHRRLFVFEKQRSDPITRVYAADLRGVRPGDALDLQLVARVPIQNVTAADVGHDGVILKNNSGGLLFPWSRTSVVRTLRRSTPCPVALPAGESVAFSASGHRIYTIPEGSDPPIEYAARG
jgi:hypothetical protein